MENLTVACTANRRMQEEFRRKERLMERQRSRLISRMGRERSELFDKLIQLNVRTPHPGTRPSDSERVTLARVRLDIRAAPPQSLSVVLGRTIRRRPTYVTPLLEQRGGDVFCELQEDRETRRKLKTDTRTHSLLYKTTNIARCLEAIRGGTNIADLSTGTQHEDFQLPRSKTFTHGFDDKPSSVMSRIREQTFHGVQDINKRIYDNKVDRHSAVNANIHRMETTHQHVSYLDISPKPGSDTDRSGKTLNRCENLVYFNLSCRRMSPHKQPRTVPRDVLTSQRRQSLLKGYVPYRGVPGDRRGGTLTAERSARQKSRNKKSW